MPPRTSPRKKATTTAVKAEKEVVHKANGAAAKAKVIKTKIEAATPKKRTASKKRKAADDTEDEDHQCDSHNEEEQDEKEKPGPKKRKTKKDKEADAMPLAARTAVSSLERAMFIGAHVSGAGGCQNSIQNAVHIGANSFALFLKSQRKWVSPALKDDDRDAFHAAAKGQKYDQSLHVLPHGSYLVNLAQADKAKADQAYDNFVDDLKRCDALGIKLYNFHPGSTGGETMASACGRIAAQLNKSHRATRSVVTVLENMCGHGNIIGGRFEDLRDIIAGVEDKSRVGVCIDTCHSFAAGYDLATPEGFAAVMAEFDRVVGLRYLKALHLNDSKAPFGSHRDLHANIGTGFMGLRAFHNVMNYDGFQNLPMVLETPIDRKSADGKTVEDKQVWADEIKLLEWLIGADSESKEFKERESELSAKGEAERKKIQEQVDKKVAKDAKKGTKKKGKKASSDDEDSE
ncbi:dna-(apurinic or apyrimidinic site) lyase 1 [Diaporthe amygdali]|uniref:dna-(apurinic or apyrimidinic site) lyase 1 n=1 Tax=Phomopsis amygdali TaxID=1214568 RepID=UPI0022FEB27A|nr:dna-(apurinic or apyrimidinic site) lyase 1 [Diaporthe amygdali]KAJ0121314.1 dna-(apurinic or apyrimidinic site) lyase 1 [Diaporthe amygdali]